MQYSSLKELIEERKACPICKAPTHFDFQIVGDKAYLKSKRGDSDVYLQVTMANNVTHYQEIKTPFLYSNYWGINHTRSELRFSAHCRNKNHILRDSKILETSFEYSFDFKITLNQQKSQIKEIKIHYDKFSIVENDRHYIARVGYEDENATIIINENDNRHIFTVPSKLFSRTEKSRDSLLRKFKAISLMR